MIEFKLPSLGSDMEEGKLLQWNVKPGDAVKRGDVVAVVDTSKAAVDVEIWKDGTMLEQLVPIGETVPVGAVIATLLEPGETAEDAARKKREAPAAPVAAKPAAPAAPRPAAAPIPSGERKAASPAARRRARELNVDIEKISGTGPHGAVTIEDVEKAAAKPAAAPADRYAEMRKAIAAAMSRSKREIPHYYLGETVPMRRAVEWLTRENEKRPITERVLMGALQLKAVARALAKSPELNGFWRDGAFEPATGVHIGVAISIRQGGLIAPAIHDVDKKSVPEIMRALTDLVARARAGSLRSSEMSDPTITVSSLGERGVEALYGIIYPPQVAIVGFGKVLTRPWIVDGVVVPRSIATATLAADHRVSDGHAGALFLAEIGKLLQEPERL